MLKIEKQTRKTPDGKTQLVVQMSGVVDEHSNLPTDIGLEGFDSLSVDCRAVSRINSEGVVKWIRYFGQLERAKKPVVLTNVSPPLVSQFSLVSNMVCGAWIESLCLPYLNEDTNTSLMALVTAESIKNGGFKVPKAKDKDGTPLEFDEMEDEYLACLRRQYHAAKK